MAENEKTKKNDFVEITFTGYTNGEMFDSNIPENLKKLNKEAKAEKFIVSIGNGMVVEGLDKALEGKEFGKQYKTSFGYKEGFGPRDRNMIKVIPLKSFTEQNINPYPGLMLALDNQVVKIIAVSGARVTADFNNPLSGKDLEYEFTITKRVTDKKEMASAYFKFFFRFIPEHEIKGNKAIIKLPKGLESMLEPHKEKFKTLTGMELEFEELKKEDAPKEEKAEEKSV